MIRSARLAAILATVIIAHGASAPLYAQSYASVGAVELEAAPRVSPPRITLRWTPMTGATGFTIHRKLWGATSWGSPLATLPGSAVQYDDDTASVGVHYEYRVLRMGSPPRRGDGANLASAAPGTGYVSAGIEVPAIEQPGSILLVIDDTVAAPLAARLTQLESDLTAEGWLVRRLEVSRTAAPPMVRAAIRAAHDAEPRGLRAVFLIGHVPVPYAGNLAPDGHDDHRGAWPADSYYADLDGAYTDTSVNAGGASRTENRNVPGDGRFDQSSPPSEVEVEVGRIDFARMPAFSRTELELLADYLDRAHGFRTRAWVPMERGIVWDNLDWAGYPLAAAALRASAALVGPATTRSFSAFTTPNIYGTTYYAEIDGQSYLFGAHLAGGSYTGSGAGSTAELAGSVESGVVFTVALGSYFGDWDSSDNFLRAQIARGAGLASVWSGLPNWWLHPLGLGETTGACMRITVDNNAGLYAPLSGGWEPSVGRGHLALMGDPALRLRYVGVPTGLSARGSGSTASFTWTAPADAPDGYHLYEVDPATRRLTRLVPERITGTSYRSDTLPLIAGRTYAVRAARLEEGATGSYWNLGLAAFAVATTSTMGGADAGPDTDAGSADAGSAPLADAGPTDAAISDSDADLTRADAGALGRVDAGTTGRDAGLGSGDGGSSAGPPARLEGTMGCTVTRGGRGDLRALALLALGTLLFVAHRRGRSSIVR